MDTSEKNNAAQTIATALSVLLPILQVFTGLLPSNARTLILFNDQFLIVSVFAAIISYILIVAFKNTVWFKFTFQFRKHNKYVRQMIATAPGVMSEVEMREFIKNDKFVTEPQYITPLNVYNVLIPTTIASLLIFVFLGLFFPGTPQDAIIFIQATIYIFLVSIISLTLGVFYINEINKNKRENNDKISWEMIKNLLFARQALPELPTISFVASFNVSNSADGRIRTIIKVNEDSYYAVDCDLDNRKMFEINRFNPDDKSVKPLNEEAEVS